MCVCVCRLNMVIPNILWRWRWMCDSKQHEQYSIGGKRFYSSHNVLTPSPRLCGNNVINWAEYILMVATTALCRLGVSNAQAHTHTHPYTHTQIQQCCPSNRWQSPTVNTASILQTKLSARWWLLNCYRFAVLPTACPNRTYFLQCAGYTHWIESTDSFEMGCSIYVHTVGMRGQSFWCLVRSRCFFY